MSRNTSITLPWLGIVALLCLTTASSSFAGRITDVTEFGSEDGTGPGVGAVTVAIIVTLNPNNDNVDDEDDEDNNISVPVKRFDHTGYIDIEFLVEDTDGTTEYELIESIDNNTFVNWSSYEMYLGFGVGGEFDKAEGDDGLDFDDPDYDDFPSSTAFSTVLTPDADTLIFQDGVQSTGSQVYRLRIDVPDGIDAFTLRQVPFPVPEPLGAWLILIGGLFMAARLRRR